VLDSAVSLIDSAGLVPKIQRPKKKHTLRATFKKRIYYH
jgi:hypothetical protein